MGQSQCCPQGLNAGWMEKEGRNGREKGGGKVTTKEALSFVGYGPVDRRAQDLGWTMSHECQAVARLRTGRMTCTHAVRYTRTTDPSTTRGGCGSWTLTSRPAGLTYV